MRLSPKHPWWVAAGYGLALHLVGRKEKAIQMYKDALALNPNQVRIYAHLAAVYADLDRVDEAGFAATEALEHDPSLSANSYLETHPFHDPERTAWYKALLLRADCRSIPRAPRPTSLQSFNRVRLDWSSVSETEGRPINRNQSSLTPLKLSIESDPFDCNQSSLTL